MDEKNIQTPYSWGPFYETLQELEGISENEDVEKGLTLIRALEKAQTKKEILQAVKDSPLTETQRMRMCSPCLDGILRSIAKKDPTVRIIKENLGIDAYMYFVSRKLGRPRLALACRHGRIEYVKFIIENIIRKNVGDEALIWACESGFIDIVKILLENFEWRYKTIEKSVYIISGLGKTEILRLFIPYIETYKFSIQSFINTIENTVRNGHIDTLKLLLENYSGWSTWALVFAINKKYFDAAKAILIMDFIKITKLQGVYNSCASTIIKNGYTDLLELLLKRGINFGTIRYIRDWKTAQFFLDHNIPLIIENFEQSQNITELLLEKLGYSNLNITVNDLLLHAILKSDKEGVKKLLLKGAKIESGYIRKSLWKYHFEEELFKLLVDANAVSQLDSN